MSSDHIVYDHDDSPTAELPRPQKTLAVPETEGPREPVGGRERGRRRSGDSKGAGDGLWARVKGLFARHQGNRAKTF